MAIRLRAVEGHLVALCAALSEPREGDVYLNDAQHYALTLKGMWERGELPDDHPSAILMDREQHGRDASLEVEAWLERCT